MADKKDFSKLLQIIVHLQDDNTFQDHEVRFWLPQDRPVAEVLRAMVDAAARADTSPFRVALRPDVAYSLCRGTHALDPDMNLREQRVDASATLRLKPAPSSVKAYLFTLNRRDGIIAQPDSYLGVAAPDFTPEIELTPYIESHLRVNVAARHAQVRVLQSGDLALQVLGASGITVIGDKPYAPGSVIILAHGMLLGVQNANIEVESWQPN